ncbi:hypothetical protein [Paraferrimonas sp. SM1919]|uniref:hypothetical protein n=1 Tax=Paraferrimonas sp. SM1919 TaxID=2662263 RepID=UPI0013D5E358|nr:hypothetical protein [Paraferrimonas sp. SM1919]
MKLINDLAEAKRMLNVINGVTFKVGEDEFYPSIKFDREYGDSVNDNSIITIKTDPFLNRGDSISRVILHELLHSTDRNRGINYQQWRNWGRGNPNWKNETYDIAPSERQARAFEQGFINKYEVGG